MITSVHRDRLKGLWGLVNGPCEVCSNKMGVLEAIEGKGPRLPDKMSGNPSMAGYR